MTSEELRAIDATIAEKVMGWRVTIGETSHKGRVIAWPDPDGEGVCFEPSTNIADAWIVVEMMCVQFRGADVSIRLDGGPDGWDCELGILFGSYGDSVPNIMYRAVGETAPLAICKAALKTVKGLS